MGIDPGSIADVVVTGSNCAATGNCDVTVTVHIPLPGHHAPGRSLLFPDINLSASSTMRIERVYANP